MRRGEGRAGAGDMFEHQAERIGGNDLEALDRRGERHIQPPEQRERGLRGRQTDPCDRAIVDRRHQPQRDRGDDAERAFRADQQLFQIIAAIVLLERGEAAVERAIGQHRLDASDQRPHGPEPQHLRAAGIGRGETADRRRPPGTERQREAPADRQRRIVEIGQDHPRFGDRQIVIRRDQPQPVHPAQRQ